MNANSQSDRHVAFFDALGFREAINRNVDEAWGALEDLRVSMEETLDFFVKLPNGEILVRNRERTMAVNFSDSVILFTRGGRREDLHSILVSSAAFFAKALHRCVPLRGCISYGAFRFNFEKNLFCGSPLINAYDLAESTQWSGIAVDPRVAELYAENPLMSSGRRVLAKWSVRLKRNGRERKQNLWVLDWPTVCRENFTCNAMISAELYTKAFESLFGGAYEEWSENVRAKYDDTVTFINAMLAREGG